MTKLKIVIHQEAIQDLDEIWLYTFQNWSLEQADRYYGLIYQEIEFLSARPELGKNMDHVITGYRAAQIKSHLIFYRFTSTELEVIRILHGNMDIPSILNG